MNTTYKGFTIYQANKDGSGTLYYVDALEGKGYSSSAAAKGAITRWVNANVEAVQKQEEAPAQDVKFGDVDYLKEVAPVVTVGDLQNIELRVIAQNIAHADAESAKVYAECVYYGLIKHGKAMTSQKYLSRNKREGKYAGKSRLYCKNKYGQEISILCGCRINKATHSRSNEKLYAL